MKTILVLLLAIALVTLALIAKWLVFQVACGVLAVYAIYRAALEGLKYLASFDGEQES